MNHIVLHTRFGLTLIELMVVMVILAIISSIAIPAFQGYITTASTVPCSNEVAAIRLAEEDSLFTRNAYFAGADAVALRDNSGGTYLPSPEALAGTANCAFQVIVNAPPNQNQYRIIATGINKFAGKGTITQFQNY